jgi:hypothetical protein
MAKFIGERGGWLISIPGGPVMPFETRLGSTLPDELRRLGHEVTRVGEATRVVPHETVEVIAAALSSMPPLRVVLVGTDRLARTIQPQTAFPETRTAAVANSIRRAALPTTEVRQWTIQTTKISRQPVRCRSRWLLLFSYQ